MINKLFFEAGHNLGDPGAVTNHPVVGTKKESELAIDLRNGIKSDFEAHNNNPVIIDDDTHSLSRVIAEINKLIEDDDILISIHFNVFNGKVSGTEVFVKNNPRPEAEDLGEDICETISSTLGIPNRGVKTESQSQWNRLGILHGKGIRVLVEVCFMDNPKDLEAYIKYKHILQNELSIDIEEHI